MQEVFFAKLNRYIAENNPDLLIVLQEEGNLNVYLREKVAAVDLLVHELIANGTPAYIIEERCMDELTKELRPSKFNYLVSVLEEEFNEDYQKLKENKLLTYEVINLIKICMPVFETFGLTEEAESNRQLRYAIVGAVKEYFEKSSEREK